MVCLFDPEIYAIKNGTTVQIIKFDKHKINSIIVLRVKYANKTS